MNSNFNQLIALFSCIFLTFSCSKKEEKSTSVPINEITVTNDTVTTNTAQTKDTIAFDITKIPVSEINLNEVGEFPFLKLPKNIQYQNKPLQREYDDIYFPLGPQHNFVKLSGKSFKSYLVKSDTSTSDWSLPYFEKMYDEAITKLGGRLIYEGKVSEAHTNFLKENARYLGEEGSIDYWNDMLKVYAIRSPKNDHVYIQLSGNTANGSIQILQQEGK